MNIHKIVLTGGPCAGKTKVIEGITKKLKKNYYVITIPETASEQINNNMFPQGNQNHNFKYQENILQAQLTKEQVAMNYAQSIIDNNLDILKNKKDVIILYDRGIMDNRAYLTHQEYNNLLQTYNINELEYLNKYDLVFDLISTATAKPELYELNDTRYETIEEAALKDQLTSSAWLLHPNLYTIMPTDTIEEKIKIIYTHIINYLNKLKFLLPFNDIHFYIDKEKSDFTIFNENNSRKIKITSYNIINADLKKYTLCKNQYNTNTSYTIKRQYNEPLINIDEFTYNTLLNLKLIYNPFHEEKIHFIHKGNHYYIREFKDMVQLYANKNQIEDIPKELVLKKTL